MLRTFIALLFIIDIAILMRIMRVSISKTGPEGRPMRLWLWANTHLLGAGFFALCGFTNIAIPLGVIGIITALVAVAKLSRDRSSASDR